MKSIIKFYVIGASENILKMNTSEYFRKSFEKRENIKMFFGKEIKLKGDNNDALQSGRDTFFSVIKRL